ncbi:MAG: hypothetical protein JWP25_9020 [Bradyrhizobium sp.]|nr:hypothetical protein [Bradyrhizobium sp.]
MGRKKKSEATAEEPKRTVADLDDDQRQVLFFSHKKSYEDALAAKKTAAANFLNATKLAKAELGKGAIKDIKTALALELDGGEETLKADIENQLRVARWMGAPLGSQADLFGDADRTPLADRAFAEGRRDGIAGNACRTDHAPSTEAYTRFMAGYQEGQAAAIAKGGGFKGSGSEDDVRPGFLKRKEAEAVDSLAKH